MPRYDVYANPGGPGWLLDVQADILEGLDSRIVVPLMPVGDAPKPAARLNPIFDVAGGRVSMVTQYLAAVPRSMLHEPTANLSSQHTAIIGALDMLFLGF